MSKVAKAQDLGGMGSMAAGSGGGGGDGGGKKPGGNPRKRPHEHEEAEEPEWMEIAWWKGKCARCGDAQHTDDGWRTCRRKCFWCQKQHYGLTGVPCPRAAEYTSKNFVKKLSGRTRAMNFRKVQRSDERAENESAKRELAERKFEEAHRAQLDLTRQLAEAKKSGRVVSDNASNKDSAQIANLQRRLEESERRRVVSENTSNKDSAEVADLRRRLAESERRRVDSENASERKAESMRDQLRVANQEIRQRDQIIAESMALDEDDEDTFSQSKYPVEQSDRPVPPGPVMLGNHRVGSYSSVGSQSDDGEASQYFDADSRADDEEWEDVDSVAGQGSAPGGGSNRTRKRRQSRKRVVARDAAKRARDIELRRERRPDRR